MRYMLCAVLVSLLSFSGGCPPPPPPMTFAMIVSGPATMANNTSATYTVTMGAGGKPTTLDFQTPAPLWLQESDGTLMSFTQSVHLPPGVTAQNFTLTLSCQKGKVQGTALTLPGGTPNNPVSSGGTGRAAMVFVRFQNLQYDNTAGNIGNVLSITCTL